MMELLSPRIEEAYQFISSVNKQAYRYNFLLSSQVLSKNPYTSNFLEKFVFGQAGPVIEKKAGYIMLKLLKYYFFSIKNFISYLMEFIEFYLSGLRFRFAHNSGELIILGNYFIIKEIQRKQAYKDEYFSGLADILQKDKKDYVYLPVFDGIKKRLAMLRIFRILKDKRIPVLTEYQLLSYFDLCRIFFFIIAYPFFVLGLAKRYKNDIPGHRILKDELVETLEQVTFQSYSRYLQGKKIAGLAYNRIKVISWYENQVIDKNLFKGLSRDKAKVKTYGAQLLIYSKNNINILADENELEFGIVPDKILVNGKWFIPKLSSLNYAVGPSLRYSKIFDAKIFNCSRHDIAVCFPYLKRDDLIAFLSLIKEASKDIDVPLVIKSHPAIEISEFSGFLPLNCSIFNGDLYNLLGSTKILIGAASGTLIEAVSLGIPVIFIRNSVGLDYNPLAGYGKGIIWEEAASPEELRVCIQRLSSNLQFKKNEINEFAGRYKKDFFQEPSLDVIINSFDLN